MDDNLVKPFARMTAQMREARASEVSFLNALHDGLKLAWMERNWKLVRDLMTTVDNLADDLSSVDANAS